MVNDGSTDDSESVIRRYQQVHSKISLYTIENQGVSNARNVAISKATGEYITFVDGDDTVESDFFEKAVYELDRGGYDFVQENFRIIDGDNTRYEQFVSEDIVITDKYMMLDKLFGVEKIIHNAACGKVYRSETIKDILFDRTIRIAEDQKFVFDVIEKSKKIKLLSHVGYNYIQRSTSAMHDVNINGDIDKLKVLSYCKKRVSNTSIMQNIEMHELLTFLEMYHITAINGGDNEKCYNRLCAFDIKPIKNSLNNNVKLRIFLIKHARFIYDLILRKRHKNPNGK